LVLLEQRLGSLSQSLLPYYITSLDLAGRHLVASKAVI